MSPLPSRQALVFAQCAAAYFISYDEATDPRCIDQVKGSGGAIGTKRKCDLNAIGRDKLCARQQNTLALEFEFAILPTFVLSSLLGLDF